MSVHKATIVWRRQTDSFDYADYNRDHSWDFESVQVAASSAPGFLGDAARVDPEEAFVASLSSCHMLTFLALASKKRFVVDAYRDEATGVLAKNADGKLAVTRVTLRPVIDFSGDRQPDAAAIRKMHDRSHEECFIANSVRTEVVVEVAGD
ncbi:MAG: OsmC family protein [Gammaproteobacteria bacterium]|nr:OsmC family protein [Gammaproteobacteria bacterium]NNF60549.1 OsmC family peroxiredoxin [Gammaproteobacteria bacterium]NNM20269.1 OsmC family peroxiredoxin [Gammaproteobacteria bacterium]